MKEYQVHQFTNGLRLVHQQVAHSKIAHCGFILDLGSRDEAEHQQGLAHFWEHMAFKGTEKRKVFHIISRLENVGGDLNAYTTKEKICFHASLLAEHFEMALELLTDITFRSIFPEKEIEKEKGVILEEMSMYRDDPADDIQDQFDELIFGKHPLGKNILGTNESVNNFTRPSFLSFLKDNLDTSRIIFSSVSPLPFAKVIRLAEKYLKDLPQSQAVQKREKFLDYSPKVLEIKRPITQAHCMIGTEAYSLYDDKRLPFFTLVNILGGNGMNSRLSLVLREKYGYVYTVDASNSMFVDTGMFSVYFASDRNLLEKCLHLTLKELKQLREKPLGSLQLHHAKNQIMGQLAMAEESKIGMMLLMGKSLLDLNDIESLENIFKRIRSITAQELQDIANEIFDEKRLSTLSFIPEKS